MTFAFEDRNRREVVTDDGNDPDTSWQNHVDRTGNGGVDHVAPLGTSVYADGAGVVRLVPLSDGGSGGRMVAVKMGNGWSEWYVHLRDFSVADGATVRAGALLGHSGGSGYGEDGHYIPHLHRHLIDAQGQRQNPWHYFGGDGGSDTRAVKPGVIVATLDSGVPNDTFYRRLLWWARANGGYKYAIEGDLFARCQWRAVQRGLHAGGYYAPSTYSGVEDVETWKALQRLARAQGGYTGPIDGDPGVYTYRALSRAFNLL